MPSLMDLFHNRLDEFNKVIHKEWQTSVEEKGDTTSIIQFDSWPEDVGADKLKCALFSGANLIAESERVHLISHGTHIFHNKYFC